MSVLAELQSGFHERHSTCPSCGCPVRITRDEQEQRRTFCAVCDAQFDISAQAVDEPSPFRQATALDLIPIPAVPPTQMVTAHLGDASGVTLRPASRFRLAVTFGDVPASVFVAGWFLMEILKRLGIDLDVVLGLAFMLVATFVYRTIPRLARQETLEMEGSTLVVRERALRMTETRIAVQGIAGVRVSSDLDRTSQSGRSAVVRIDRADMPTVTIGRGYGYDRHVAEWLERWIKSKLTPR